jgi:hypothetical protein
VNYRFARLAFAGRVLAARARFRLTGADRVPLSGPRCAPGKCRARALAVAHSDNMGQCHYCGLPVCASCGVAPVGEWPADPLCARCGADAQADAQAEARDRLGEQG